MTKTTTETFTIGGIIVAVTRDPDATSYRDVHVALAELAAAHPRVGPAERRMRDRLGSWLTDAQPGRLADHVARQVRWDALVTDCRRRRARRMSQ